MGKKYEIVEKLDTLGPKYVIKYLISIQEEYIYPGTKEVVYFPKQLSQLGTCFYNFFDLKVIMSYNQFHKKNLVIKMQSLIDAYMWIGSAHVDLLQGGDINAAKQKFEQAITASTEAKGKNKGKVIPGVLNAIGRANCIGRLASDFQLVL